MTATTATLTDFLLARIAQDEATATRYHRLLCLRTACDADGCVWGEREQEAMERERVCTCGYPARVLAECAAKRAIVEGLVEADREHSVDFELGFGLYVACQLLAAIYADHPDFRDDWGP